MNGTQQTDKISKVIAEILNSQKFKNIKVMASRACTRPTIIVKLIYEKEIPEGRLQITNEAMEEVGNYLKEFNNMILNTDIVKKGAEENRRLTAEVERLRKFENYYRMHFAVNNGKSIKGIEL